MKEHLDNYLIHLRARHLKKETIENKLFYLTRFLNHLAVKNISLYQITISVLEDYQKQLWESRSRTNPKKKISFAYQGHHISTIKDFFSYLKKNNIILTNPASLLRQPRSNKSLPSKILSLYETKTLFSLADLKTPLGIRDRAIMEVLAATGIRRAEIVNLLLEDIDYDEKTIRINNSKGLKDRIIPISKRALKYLQKYLDKSRLQLLKDKESNFLFLTIRGGGISISCLTNFIHEYFKKAGIVKEKHQRGGCHIFRHTLATVMLENGADLRYIQEMLGHSTLASTQIYTRVSITKLKEIHEKTHPLSK